VFPMPASAWAGNHPDRLLMPSAVTCGPGTAALPGITFLPRNAPQIRHFAESARYLKPGGALDGPARKAADGGNCARSLPGRASCSAPLWADPPAGGGGVSGGGPEPAHLADARAALTLSRSCRGVGRVDADPASRWLNELLRAHSSPIRRNACTAASPTGLPHGRTVRDAVQNRTIIRRR
jgi:hypothetical protein